MTSNYNKREDTSEGAPLLPSPQDRLPPQALPPEVAAMMSQYGSTNPPSVYAGGYYPDPTTAAAFAPGASPQPYFYQGYPPQNYTSIPPPSSGQPPPYYMPQGYSYPSPYGPAAVSTAQRPPRSQRRGNGSKLTPSPTNSSRKAVPDVNAMRTPPFSSMQDSNVAPRDRSSIPPLQDIFSDSQPFVEGTSPGAYGSTSNAAVTTQTPPIYNAPPRNPSKNVNSNRTPSTLVRTNSASDFKQHPLKAPGKTDRSHRRINSDLPLRGASHRRVGSSDELPPIGAGHRRVRSGSSRGRSYSAGHMFNKRPTHRRADSASSMASNVSMSSVVSNIAKSEFFGGVDSQGRVQMHFPFESIRLVMIDPEKPTLSCGHLYLDGHAADLEQFEEYHRLTSAEEGGIGTTPNWESFDRPSNVCGCNCNNCNGCLGKKQLLPHPKYLLAVEDNIYRRVMGEIDDAHSMPCGLFFCGHHEDVAHPSIHIAIVLVTVLFACLIFLAFYTGDMTVT